MKRPLKIISVIGSDILLSTFETPLVRINLHSFIETDYTYFHIPVALLD